MDLTQVGKLPLAQLPTPLYKMEQISLLAGKNIYVKRDDMTGVALGGNKVRKLEYLLADAVAKGCDSVITTGGAQSNHATLTAACCRRIGMDPYLILQGRGVMETKGNLLLDQLLEAPVEFVDTDDMDDVYAAIRRKAEELEEQGHHPCIIPMGGSVPLGCLGYAACIREIAEQARAMEMEPDHIVCCVGSGGTYGGVLLGTALYAPEAKVTGIVIGAGADFASIGKALAEDAAGILEEDVTISEDKIHLFDYYGEGYAIPSKEGNDAIRLMARSESIILDPVYTGKTFAGLMDLLKQGYFDEDDNIVFLHTGGVAGLFAIPLE